MKMSLMAVLLLGACAAHTPACRVEGCDPAKPWTCECSSQEGGGTDGRIYLGGGGDVGPPDVPDTEEPGGGSGSSDGGDGSGDGNGGDSDHSDDSGSDDHNGDDVKHDKK